MADVTVAQFAEVLKVPVAKLLTQLDEAGIKVSGSDDKISEDAKLELLTHLRRSHGQDDTTGTAAAPRKITLKRKSQSELRLSGAQGRSRTVNVEVRRKRTYIKRDVLEKQAQDEQDALDRSRQEEEARLKAEELAKQKLIAEKEAAEKRELEAIEKKAKAEKDAEQAARAEAKKIASDEAAIEKAKAEKAETDTRIRKSKDKEKLSPATVKLDTGVKNCMLQVTRADVANVRRQCAVVRWLSVVTRNTGSKCLLDRQSAKLKFRPAFRSPTLRRKWRSRAMKSSRSCLTWAPW